MSEKGKSFEGRLKEGININKRPEIVSHSNNVRIPFRAEEKVGRNRLSLI